MDPQDAQFPGDSSAVVARDVGLGLRFDLRLPLDPRSHSVFGSGNDTVGDVIRRLVSGLWKETDIVICTEMTTLRLSDRMLDSVSPGSPVTVSSNLRAHTIPLCSPAGPDHKETRTRYILHNLPGPQIEVSYYKSDRSLGDRPRLHSFCDPHMSPIFYLTLHGRVLDTASSLQPLSVTSLRYCSLRLMCRLRGGMDPEPALHYLSARTRLPRNS
jgi:hypothetical protein